MKRVLVMCASDPESDPRPNRMIRLLKNRYAVTALGLKRVKIRGVESIGVPRFEVWGRERIRRRIRKGFALLGTLLRLIHLRRMAYRLWTNINAPLDRFTDSVELTTTLREKDFDLIVSHDLVLLPLAFRIGKKAKVLLDAREFYPQHYEDRPLWRLLRQPLMDYLSLRYLPRCDRMITVSEGIAQEYNRRFKVQSSVIMSLPDYHDLSPVQPNDGKIRMIHHGIISISRRPEQMIEMMDYVDERFSLDLMLIPEKSSYWNRLIEMVNRRKNVRVIPPVPMKEIIPFTNSYDIGLFFCPPTTFNLTYALPNKFFEFIQARLAVAIGPSIEMRKIVERYDCGVVAENFNPKSMAEALNKLTTDRIMYYKKQSDKASLELSSRTNSSKMLSTVQELIES